jgi:hypothetical protein
MINSGTLRNLTFRSRRCRTRVSRKPLGGAAHGCGSRDDTKRGRKKQHGSAWTSSSTIATGTSGTSRYGQPFPVNSNEAPDQRWGCNAMPRHPGRSDAGAAGVVVATREASNGVGRGEVPGALAARLDVARDLGIQRPRSHPPLAGARQGTRAVRPEVCEKLSAPGDRLTSWTLKQAAQRNRRN